MKRCHGQNEPLLDPGHVDPAGINVVVVKAGQHDTVFIERKQVAVSVLVIVPYSSLT